MPDNYLYLGLLAILFPSAVFIHCRRDLRDVAVSCWMTDFRSIRWANDRDHIASRFQQYHRLMDHWQDVLPVPIHEVDYEETVADLEAVARRLVAACGLDWEPACLEFHRTERPVRTASVMQVRQPVYQRSVARWKHYEPALGELFAALPARSNAPLKSRIYRRRSPVSACDGRRHRHGFLVECHSIQGLRAASLGKSKGERSVPGRCPAPGVCAPTRPWPVSLRSECRLSLRERTCEILSRAKGDDDTTPPGLAHSPIVAFRPAKDAQFQSTPRFVREASDKLGSRNPIRCELMQLSTELAWTSSPRSVGAVATRRPALFFPRAFASVPSYFVRNNLELGLDPPQTPRMERKGRSRHEARERRIISKM